jgi:hypothetical protein
MEPTLGLEAFKTAIGLIKNAYSALMHSRNKSKQFWLEDVLEPVQSGMTEVHGIYLKIFNEALDGLSQKRMSVQDLLKFLTDKHYETVALRDDLQGLRLAAYPLHGLPEDIRSYLQACEEYFGDSTQTALRTPLRALLEKLRKVDRITGLTISQIEELAPMQIGNIAGEVRNGIELTEFHLERAWPKVVEKYHRARLVTLRDMH